MQRELVVIVCKLGREDFNGNDGIVTITNRYCYDLNRVSDEILNVLTDKSLILDFFMRVEIVKLKILKDLQQKNTESYTKK